MTTCGVFLGLGSNQGDRWVRLTAALEGLGARGARPLRSSPLYRTEPVGGPPQPEFLNLVVEVETSLEPRELMELAHQVETEGGRHRPAERWGARPLDVDLLLFGDRVIAEDGLRVPHPRLHRRRFVLIPLADLAPELLHPVLGRSIRDLLDACPDRAAVTPVATEGRHRVGCPPSR